MNNRKEDNRKIPPVYADGANDDPASSNRNDDRSDGVDHNRHPDADNSRAAEGVRIVRANFHSTAPAAQFDQDGMMSVASTLGNFSTNEIAHHREMPPAEQPPPILYLEIGHENSPTAPSAVQAGSSTVPSVANNVASRVASLSDTTDRSVTVPTAVPLDERTVMARALGIPRCDYREPPFNKHKVFCSPTKKDLYKEFQRRLSLSGIKLTKATRAQYPNKQNPLHVFAKWLHQNPIRDQDEIQRLRLLVQVIKTRIANPSQSSHSANPVAVAANDQDNGGNEGEGGGAAAVQYEMLEPRELMARALGLPGCSYQQDPFEHFRMMCWPTRKELYPEFQRRCSILGIDLNNNNSRSLLPNVGTRKPRLVSWLIDNPIPNTHPEVENLRSQVESLRTRLQAEIVSRQQAAVRQDPLQPSEWSSLRLNWSEDDSSDDESFFDTSNAELASLDDAAPSPAVASTRTNKRDRSEISVTAPDVDGKDDSTDDAKEPAQAKQKSSEGLSESATEAADEHFNSVTLGVNSGDSGVDVASLSSSLMRVSLATISECGSMSTGDRSTLTSSQGNSGLTPRSGERIRGGGVPLVTVGEDRAVNLPVVVHRQKDDASMSAMSGCHTYGAATDVSMMDETKSTATLEKESTESLAGGEEGRRDKSGEEQRSSNIRLWQLPRYDESTQRHGRSSSTETGLRKVVQTIAETDDVSLLIRTMREHILVVEVQEEACSVLSHLALSDDYGKQIGEADGIEVLVLAMQTHRKIVNIQEDACCILKNLACISANQEHIAKADGISSIVCSMREHESVPAVQGEGCAAIHNLAWDNTSNQHLIRMAGGVEVIVRGMRRQEWVVEVQRRGCSALSVLGWNVHNQEVIGGEGGISAVITAMRLHKDDTNVQVSACGALWSLAAGNDMNKELIRAAGGFSEIVRSMQQHDLVADIQTQGCGALRNLALSSDTNKQKIVEEGGIGVIVRAMRQHEMVAAIQAQGSCALRNLIEDNEGNQKILLEADAVPVMIRSMRLHSSVASVQEEGRWILCCLASCLDSLEAGTAGIADILRAIKPDWWRLRDPSCRIAIILCAMQENPSKPDIQAEGCAALARFAVKDECRKLLIDAKGFCVIVHSMKQHRSAAHVQAAGCAALSRLAFDDESRKLIAEVSGIAAIVHAMKQHSSDANVQRCGCWALLNLSVRTDNQKLIKEGDGISVIVNSIVRYEAVVSVQLPACGALASLLWKNEDTQKVFWEADQVSGIIQAILQRDFMAVLEKNQLVPLEQLLVLDEETRELIADAGRISVAVEAIQLNALVAKIEGCIALLKLSLGSDNNKKVVAAVDGLSALVTAVKEHESVAGVQQEGCLALQELAFTRAKRELVVAAREVSLVVMTMYMSHAFKMKGAVL